MQYTYENSCSCMCQEMVFVPVCDRMSKELSQTSRGSSRESWLITLVGKFCKWPPLEKWLSLAQLLSSGMILKKYLMTWPIMATLDLDGGIKNMFYPIRKICCGCHLKKSHPFCMVEKTVTIFESTNHVPCKTTPTMIFYIAA